MDEHPDRIRQQIVTVFPNFVVQKTQNAMALRFFVPNGVSHTNLEWIYFGYADDTSEMRKRRLRHLNLGGPAGFVSMEDGCIGGFVERGIATAERKPPRSCRWVVPASRASPPARPKPQSVVSGRSGGAWLGYERAAAAGRAERGLCGGD